MHMVSAARGKLAIVHPRLRRLANAHTQTHTHTYTETRTSALPVWQVSFFVGTHGLCNTVTVLTVMHFFYLGPSKNVNKVTGLV